ncbi:hypothetical protein PybrP1_007065 [[Pythium] brassicae (nom. inval.)]|nr:hypothetical protein PybrP1_007065 [[Pythium] brassicae (nom. inval.)]
MMMHSLRPLLVAAVAALALALGPSPALAGDELCALAPGTYSAAKSAHPDAAFAIAELEKHTIATWYTDRGGNYAGIAQQLVATCPSSSRLSVVVYGLPNKDCDAGYSNGGVVKNAADYVRFLNTLTSTIGNRKVLYVLEPDAVGLLANTGGCAETSGYKGNLQTAVKLLSANPNAEIYLDIGYWTLQNPSSLAKVAGIVRDIAGAGRVKGITLNTSNFRSNSELAALCSNFQSAIGDTSKHCVIDTSRNYNGAPGSNEWCNTKTAGIGKVPTANTGFGNVDYFIWIKPPGESDGTCTGGDRSSDALRGPAAGQFFKEGFKLLWNQGALVKEMGLPAIDGTVRQVVAPSAPVPAPAPAPVSTPAPTTAEPTPAPTTAEPTPSPSPEDLTPQATVVPAGQNDTTVSSASTAGSSAAGNSTTTPTTDNAYTGVINQTHTDGVTGQDSDVVATGTDTAATPDPTSAAGSTDKVQQVSNKSGGEGSMGTGILVLVGMVGAAVVALVAVVGLRRRQQKMLDEAKTPTEPYPSYQITTTTASDSSVL